MGRWGSAQRARCNEQFDLFVSSGGKEGWDPDDTSEAYVKEKFQEDDICRPFLHQNLGGDRGNKNSEKATKGYKRAACEFYVEKPWTESAGTTIPIKRSSGRDQCVYLLAGSLLGASYLYLTLLFLFSCLQGGRRSCSNAGWW